MAPRVSVIIPTYNWSAALRLSVASALAQTFADFELLVIGDACTDDSAGVIAAIDDRRVRWHNLATRYGSQSGPNNHGLSIARGDLIAYLGHDDLWHPDHLATLVARWSETQADLVCSVMALYGPEGSGIRAVTGLLVDGAWRADDFLPPTSLMHTRALAARIGPWGDPAVLTAPVDCEWLARAHAKGATLVSTAQLTAFKFNASWRRDSYRRRDVTAHAQLAARLARDPAGTVAAESLGLVRAAREKRLIDVRMPDTTGVAPGAYYRANLQNRGFDGAAVTPLDGARRFALDDQTSAMDWHAVERSEAWGSFRWTGPSPSAVAVLPVSTPSRVRLTIELLNWFHVDLGDEVTLSVDDRPLPFTCETLEDPIVRLSAVVDRGAKTGDALRVGLSTSRMRNPYFLHRGASADERWLGVCVHWIDVAPVVAE